MRYFAQPTEQSPADGHIFPTVTSRSEAEFLVEQHFVAVRAVKEHAEIVENDDGIFQPLRGMHRQNTNRVFPAVFTVFDTPPQRAEPIEKFVHGERFGLQRFGDKAMYPLQTARAVIAGKEPSLHMRFRENFRQNLPRVGYGRQRADLFEIGVKPV